MCPNGERVEEKGSLCREVIQLKEKVADLEEDMQEAKEDIKHLMYRLPNWATLLIAVLSAYGGWASHAH